MPSVHAERRRPGDDDVERVIGERPIGSFSRQWFLAEKLDIERLHADDTDGVLRLRLPVEEQAKPRRVDIATTASSPTSIDAMSSDGPSANDQRSEPVAAAT